MFPEAMVDLPERFEVMLKQECTAYSCEDYLSPSFQRKQPNERMSALKGSRPEPTSPIFSGTSAASMSSSSSYSEGVNEDWRTKICEWSYQVIDYLDYNREIVAISLSYLDRYLCKRAVNKRTFQLVAMTTLYMACKLYHPHKMLPISSFVELSRGYLTEEHIVAMENSILKTLSWKLHPPMPLTFCQHLMLLVPSNCVSSSMQHDMMEVAKFLTELSVIDYFFVIQKPSSIGLAALLTAMEGVSEYHLSAQSKQAFMDNVLQVAGIDSSSDEVMECKERMRDIYYHQEIERTSSSSPVSVAGIVNVDVGQQIVAPCHLSSQ